MGEARHSVESRPVAPESAAPDETSGTRASPPVGQI
jgi:hypothetical protein